MTKYKIRLLNGYNELDSADVAQAEFNNIMRKLSSGTAYDDLQVIKSMEISVNNGVVIVHIIMELV